VTANGSQAGKTWRAEPQPDVPKDVPKIGLGMLLRDAMQCLTGTREELAPARHQLQPVQHLRQLWRRRLAQVELSPASASRPRRDPR